MSNRRQLNGLNRSLKRYESEMSKRWKQVLRMSAEEILTDVKFTRGNKGVPKDTGALANSGRAKLSGPMTAQVTFGGAAAPYALVQHERTDFYHPLGEARYLIRGLERFDFGKSGARAKAEHEAFQAARKARKESLS